ncbi:GFA family protein [Crenobacter sp. SG2303]|uniref:GFA family protein n=1 Tax=Crenobacter oryzisoli TaxID=3056844 RepID=A0ABT7XJT5_9NEIS|nr:GFA family protein [Crenobacter sp. SG2303]MDN0074057.1 GFA family protein [Crenobacter sp. SG2303]
MTTMKGSCLCGRVRYRLSGEPPHTVTHCHCSSCRKASGAAFVSWFTVALEQLTWTAEAPARYASSPGVERGFCPHCGTTLSYQHVQWPGEIDLTAASLDEPGRLTPTTHCWWNEHIDWVEVLDTLPHYPGWLPDEAKRRQS